MTISNLLSQFNDIAIHDRIDPFFKEDIEIFFENDDIFSLNLKRSKQKVSLYGSEHVNIRQQFFNQCDLRKRLAVFIRKIEAATISDWVYNQLGIKGIDILDVEDIGKGRTIYKFKTKQNGIYVLKEKTNDTQQQFNAIAKAFGVPSSKSWFYQVNGIYWELAPFLDEEEVFHYKKDHLFEMYATSAAFGDFIELGDRHFENYISTNNQLIAIDVSHLMEPDNEHWTKKYIAGGLYECCLLLYFISDSSQFEQYLRRFFKAYANQVSHIFDQVESVSIHDQDLGKTIKIIKEKWKNPSHFIQHMQSIYFSALNDMMDRIVYKQLLQQLHDKQVGLTKHQSLMMYQMADANRISTFFRLEDETDDIFGQIEILAREHLGVSSQYYADSKQALEPLRASLTESNYQVATAVN